MNDMDLVQLLSFEFIQRALIAGIFVALTCASLGVFLVLRKLSLIGEGLAHTSFGGIALGLLLGVTPLYVALPFAVLASILILFITRYARVYGDAAIGIVSASGISLGIILASLGGGFNIDLFSFLFGNILAISKSEMFLSILTSFAVLALIAFYFRELFSMTFDATYAKTLGIKTDRIDALFFMLTAVAVVLAIQVVGVLLVSALLILPAVSALQTRTGFRRVMLIAQLIAVASVLAGILVSFVFDIPTGAMIVCINLVIFLVMLAWRKVFAKVGAY